MSEKEEDRIDFKKLLPVLFVVLVDVLGLTIIIPILPFYAIAFNADTTTIGILFTMYPLMQFVFGPLLGSLSDRYGRKVVLALAQVGTFISLLTLAFANSLGMIFFARIIDGITGANLSTAQSVITDITSEKNRATGLGLIGATFGVGFVLGPALSGIALRLSGNNYSAPALLAAGFAFTSILLTTFVLKESLPAEKRGQKNTGNGRNFGRIFRALLDPRLGILFILTFLLQVIFGSFQVTFAPFTLNLLGLNSLGNAIFFATFGIVLAIVQGGLVGPLTKRFGERTMIYSGLLLFSAGFLISSFTPQQPVPWYSRAELIAELSQQSDEGRINEDSEQLELLPVEENKGWGGLIYLLIGILPLPVGIALIQPNIGSMVTKRSDSARIGEALGISASFTALGSIIGPSGGGFIFDLFGPNNLYLISGIGGLVLLAIVLVFLQPLPEECIGPEKPPKNLAE